MLENGLDGLVVAFQEHHVLVERFDASDQLDAIHQKDRNRGMFLAQGVQENILQIETFGHGYFLH